MNIFCPLNQKIQITAANWGRQNSNTCDRSFNLTGTLNVTNIIATVCNSQNNCSYNVYYWNLGVFYFIFFCISILNFIYKL
jgi:hypothetical protein